MSAVRDIRARVVTRRVVAALACAAALAAAALSAAGCGSLGERRAGATTGSGPVDVVTTTNFITDAAAIVGGDRVTVTGLMGPGVDPHLFKASAGDVESIREADVIFYGGLLLEAKMEDVFEEVGEDRPTFAVSERIPERELLPAPSGAPEEEEHDPHVWFDVALWKHAVEAIRDGLIEVDPEGEAEYRANAARYLRRLDRLDAETRRRLASIPERRRVLITSHDAFRYFGRAYDVDVAAIQGISTATEATTSDIERVARTIAERGVPSVFIESSVPSQTIDAVLASAARMGQEAEVGGELYSDSAGEHGTPEGHYVGMVEANVDELVEGLR